METLKIPNYIPRIADKTIAENMEAFGAVVIEGPKWCGKTSTAKNHAVSEISMADPLGDFQNRRLAELEPAIALEGVRPRLIDEWQDVPKLWDAVRFECDRATEKGQFVLTGSSTPRRKQNPHADRPRHSGAGRIVRVPMSTMTQYELGQSNGKVSLRGLFEESATRRFRSCPLNALRNLWWRVAGPTPLVPPRRKRCASPRATCRRSSTRTFMRLTGWSATGRKCGA